MVPSVIETVCKCGIRRLEDCRAVMVAFFIDEFIKRLYQITPALKSTKMRLETSVRQKIEQICSLPALEEQETAWI